MHHASASDQYSIRNTRTAKPIQFGLVAEEVAEAFLELAVRDADGNVETVQAHIRGNWGFICGEKLYANAVERRICPPVVA